jgi:Zn-dependent M28 family amino/carboxypeptidase
MPFDVYREKMVANSLSLNGTPLQEGTDYQVPLTYAANGEWDMAKIAFVQYGLVDTIANDYAGLNVKGKWVLLLSGHPEKGSPQYQRPQAYLFKKINMARQQGAIGVMIATDALSSGQVSPIAGALYKNSEDNKTTFDIPVLYVSAKTAAAFCSTSAARIKNLAKLKKANYNAKARLQVIKITEQLQSTNVIGILEGTDKKDEYVVLTAHYDHLGTRNGVVYNGADDDGSGTTAVIAMAEAFAKAAQQGYTPRRTMVFMAVSGEELGLWGSEHYTNHPLFSLQNTSVNLNTDMVGRKDFSHEKSDTPYLYIIGDDKLSTELKPLVDSANLQTHLQLDRRYNNPNDPERFYYRSDHYNFARKGVPVIFFFNGTHADYHQPTDTVEKIDFDLMAIRVKLIFYTAWLAAEKDNLLLRNIALPKQE